MSELFDVERLKRSSKRGIFASVFGVLIVLAGFGFSMAKLAGLNKDISDKTAEIRKSENQLDSINKLIVLRSEELMNTEGTFKYLRDEITRLTSLVPERQKENEENMYRLRLSEAVDSASQGNFKVAISLYTKLLEERPNDWEVLQFRGYAYYRSNNLLASRNDLKRVLADTSALHSDALFTLVLVEAKDKNEDRAVSYAKELHELDESAFNLLRSSVPVYFRQNDDFIRICNKRKTGSSGSNHH